MRFFSSLFVNNAQVSDKNVLPLEVHCLNADTNINHKGDWLQDRHVQEIVQLLRDIIVRHVETVTDRKQAAKQPTSPAADIITGSSVRVGYMFKRRPCGQQCLVPGDNATIGAENDGSLMSLNVLKDKMVVYAHPLTPGSPRGMSQLRKVLGDVNQSGSPAVRISSYFQKLSSSQTGSQLGSQLARQSDGKSGKQSAVQSVTQMQSEKTANLRCTSVADLALVDVKQSGTVTQSSFPLAPPSEGRRGKIKSILQRGDLNPTSRKRRRVRTLKKCATITGTNGGDSEDNFDIVQQSSVPRMEMELLCGNNVTISKVNHPNITLNDDNTAEDSATVVSVAQVKEMQSAMGSNTPLGISDAVSPGLTSDDDEAEKSHDLLDVSSSGQKVLNLKSKDKMSDVGFDSEVQPLSKIKDGVNESSLESVELPEGKEAGKTACSLIEHVTDIAEDHSRDSPKFRTRKFEKKVASDVGTMKTTCPSVSCNSKQNHAENKDSDLDLSSHKENLNSLNSCRLKRKCPKFSDSDSDDDLPAIKLTKTRRLRRKPNVKLAGKQSNGSQSKIGDSEIHTEILSKSDYTEFNDKASADSHKQSDKHKTNSSSDVRELDNKAGICKAAAKTDPGRASAGSSVSESKYIKIDQMTTNSKKLKISKNFFTEDDNTHQPTLNFFMKKGNKDEMKGHKDRNPQETIDEDSGPKYDEHEDMSSAAVIICKNEMDVELRNEIRSLSNITELNGEHLRYLVRTNQKYLRAIFEGKEYCERHQLYKEGGKSRRGLVLQCRVGQYSEEQIDVVMESLMAMFCQRHQKYVDYLLKVLLPEILVHIHSEVHGTSHVESEGLLAPWSVPSAAETALLNRVTEDT